MRRNKRFVILPKDKALQGPFRKSVCGTSPRCVVTGCEIADCIEQLTYMNDNTETIFQRMQKDSLLRRYLEDND
jgi:hypothetical protein